MFECDVKDGPSCELGKDLCGPHLFRLLTYLLRSQVTGMRIPQCLLTWTLLASLRQSRRQNLHLLTMRRTSLRAAAHHIALVFKEPLEAPPIRCSLSLPSCR